jgi:hypothetical protein
MVGSPEARLDNTARGTPHRLVLLFLLLLSHSPRGQDRPPSDRRRQWAAGASHRERERMRAPCRPHAQGPASREARARRRARSARPTLHAGLTILPVRMQVAARKMDAAAASASAEEQLRWVRLGRQAARTRVDQG